MGKPCLFSLSAKQNLIKTTIFKFMVLRNTLVYDSDNWSTYYFCFALSSVVFWWKNMLPLDSQTVDFYHG